MCPGSRRCRLWSGVAPMACLTARRGKGVHSPLYARISRQLPPLRSAPLLLPARPGVPTSFGEVLAGSFSIARRLDAGASFAPSPRLAPSLFPTTPPPRGADTPPGRSLSWAIAAQPLSSGSPASLGAAEPSGCRELPIGVAGSCADHVAAAAAAGPNRAVERPGRDPGARSPWQAAELFQALKSVLGGDGEKFATVAPAPQRKLWSPGPPGKGGEGRCGEQLQFPRRVQSSFLSRFRKFPSGTKGEGAVWGGGEFEVPRKRSVNFKHEQLALRTSAT